MKVVKLWTICIWIIITLLLLTNLQIYILGEKFNKYCIIEYDITDECPCKEQVSTFPEDKNFDFVLPSIPNETFLEDS